MSGTGVLTRLQMDGGTLLVRNYQDCEDIIERNKELKKIPQKSDWGRHTATIPNNILLQWMNEEAARGNVITRWLGPEMDEIIDRKLKDPDWAFLRVDK